MTVTIPVQVVDRSPLSDDVVRIRFEATPGHTLPAWEAGDHIDLPTPHGVRQYSLCGPADDGRWSIAVRKDAEGRGGSRWVHDFAHAGATLEIGAPRNTFPYRDAESFTFIAGGIGITAVLPILERAIARGADWRLLYTTRAPAPQPLSDRLPDDDRVTIWSSATRGRPDIAAVLDELPRSTVYCCGPTELIEAVEAAALERGRTLVTERFVPVALDRSPEDDQPFDLHLARSGRTVSVPPDKSALDCLGEAGVFVPSSCREGICGSCELSVLDGVVDHRDSVLDAAEREANDCFFPCVSRAIGAGLTIDA
ncbi:PDR/VanB family oxidoreductase [Microbacterium sp. NPDC089695]|uniref:PDR/VanB family oxidoreductase n=1 Tax=Microbacterium sp. NPDC089695 TaxID=3364198 RepID=UPI00382333D7